MTLSVTLSKPLRLFDLVYLTVETTEAHGTQPGLELTIAEVNPPASSPCAGMTDRWVPLSCLFLNRPLLTASPSAPACSPSGPCLLLCLCLLSGSHTGLLSAAHAPPATPTPPGAAAGVAYQAGDVVQLDHHLRDDSDGGGGREAVEDPSRKSPCICPGTEPHKCEPPSP